MTDLLPTRQRSAAPVPAAAPIPTRSAKTRRVKINLLDRPWAGHWTGVIVTPVRVPTPESLRVVWRQLIDAHPDAPLTGRMDRRSWICVPESDRDAFVRSTIVTIDDPTTQDADGYLARSLHLLPADRPILIGVGERSLLVLLSHQLGDASTVTLMIKALLAGDADGLAALTHKADLPDVVRAARFQARSHGREWWSMARRRIAGLRSGRGEDPAPTVLAPTPTPVPAASATVPAASATVSVAAPVGGTGGTAVVSVRWTTADLQPVSRWRNRHAKGMSITSVLTAATQRALLDAGLPMATDGFHSLVDLRRYRPESDQGFLAGNLAKSVRIDADPTDLRAIGDASREMVESARPVLSTVIGCLSGAWIGAVTRRRADRPAHEAGHGPVSMTFNSMPALPGLSELPWLPGAARQYIGVGYPALPQSITVFAMRMREHMQVTAAFPASMIDPERLRSALQDIPGRIDELVEAPAPTGE
jgi:hypothetical protein